MFTGVVARAANDSAYRATPEAAFLAHRFGHAPTDPRHAQPVDPVTEDHQ
jgi:hypothetical protein